MKKLLLLTLPLCLFSLTARSQGEGKVWAFGTSAGIDFTSGSAVAIKTSMKTGEGCASVSSPSGQLLFYTDGTKIWDRTGTLMPGATLLLPAHNTYLITATASTTQGAVIVPMPDSAGKYYVFSLTEQEENQFSGKLYYSVVDMSLNAGLGDVQPTRKVIPLDTGLTEKMTAVVGDRCNIWLLVHDRTTTTFKAYEITQAGLNTTPVLSNVGTLPANTYDVGTMKLSPNRKKLALCTAPMSNNGGLELYDFDAANGTLSNPLQLDSGVIYYGAAFSADNQKLYASAAPRFVYQYDLSSGVPATIKKSKYQLGILGYGSPASDLKLAPDGKIYCAGSGDIASTVDLPNMVAPACQFNISGFQLFSGTKLGLGFPNEVPIFVSDTLTTAQKITVCFRNSLEIKTDNTGWDYLWSNGATGPNQTVTKSGTYIAHYYTVPCVYHADTFIVTFSGPLPSFGAFSGCKNQHNSFVWATPQTGDTTTYTYTWTNAAGQQLQSHTHSGEGDTLFNAPPDTYQLHINELNACDTTITIILSAPTTQVSFTVDTTACAGTELQFKNTSTNNYTAFEWDFGDTTTSTDHDPTHTYPQSGTYTVRLIGIDLCADTTYTTIKVDPVPVVNAGADTAFCFREVFTLSPTVQPTSYSNYAYKWSPDTAVSNATIRNPFFVAYTTQTLILQVSTEFGCQSSDTLTVTIHDHFLQLSDTTACHGDTVQLHASGGLDYHWLNNGTYISDTTVADPFVSTLRTMQYIVWSNDAFNCVDTGYTSVRIYPNPVITLPDTITLYAGESTELNPRGNCLYYSWFPAAGLSNPNIANPILQPVLNTRYFVKGTAESGCSTTDSINVFVNTGNLLTLPNAFRPGSGANAILKPIYRGNVVLDHFEIYNRWGTKVYTSTDINAGWDGTYKSQPQLAGVYIYTLSAHTSTTPTIQKQGNITLFR